MINSDEIKQYTESDVELKIIYPLLTTNTPEGLNFFDYNIQTKHNIKKLTIDKGNASKLYYPDFAVIVEGLPIIIIEAKKPNEDLDEAYRQACLYASEINRAFPSKINPSELIIACDGLELYAGYSDASPLFKIKYEDFISTNIEFDKFLKIFSHNPVLQIAKSKRALIGTETRFKNPINLLGGKKIQNLESNNTFGENISIQYEHLFNPKLEIEKEDIVKNAYVKQNKIETHISPIDSIFEKKLDIQTIQNNQEPIELVTKFSNHQELNNKVLLLIGSVGAGKSTFTTYLKEVALKEEIRKNTFWVNLNLNDAPLNKEEIYKWSKSNLIKQIKKSNSGVDYDELSFLLDLYEDKINSLKKGILKLFSENDIEYKKTLAEHIQQYQNDIDLTLSSFINLLITQKGKSLVVVLDNCDKRNSEEQLLMFEVANWIKDNIKSIVFLPLRETTYENHKYEKPLDTVVKDLIFKINPPSLEQVLQSRIAYISKLNSLNKDGFYYLGKDIKVKYPSKDEEKYLLSILNSLFENQFFKTLISGFAGRNIRNGIEIFLDFCKSGHINEAEIMKMLQSNGEYQLPNHLISKVFIRGNRVYYTDANSRVKNLFHSNPNDNFKDPFIRISILKYLFENIKVNEVKNFEGYSKTTTLIKFLNIKGHDENRVINELKVLLKLNLIENETLNSDDFSIDDLIKITSIGIAHIKIIRNIDYLAAIAEDMWYKDDKLATRISDNLAGNGDFVHLSIQSTSDHAHSVINYLESYYNNFILPLHNSISNEEFSPIDFEHLKQSISEFDKNIKYGTLPNLEFEKQYDASIVNIQNYGIICEIVDTPFHGFLHSSELELNFKSKYTLGSLVKVKIKEFVKEHNKYNLKLS